MQEPTGEPLGGDPGHRAAHQLGMASLDVDTLLVQLATLLSSFVGVGGLSLKMVDAAEEIVLLRRGDRFKRETLYGSKILTPASFAHDALATGKPAVVDDLAAEASACPSYVSREGFKSLIAVPLLAAGGHTGVLTVYLGGPAGLSPQVLDIVSTVGGIIAAAVRNSEIVRRIEKNYFSTVEALTAAIEAKDPYTRGHSRRVTRLAVALAERFGVSEADLRDLQYGATLHDVGKIGIRGHILNKKGRLTREEYEVIKQHPLIGERIIEGVDFLQGARPIVRSHHERFDGMGYPDGLRDEEIPLMARIAAVADFFDALTSDRPYRKAYSVDETSIIIRQGIGREFDPMVAKEFLEVTSDLSSDGQLHVATQLTPEV
jgi:hypothetical protein